MSNWKHLEAFGRVFQLTWAHARALPHTHTSSPTRTSRHNKGAAGPTSPHFLVMGPLWNCTCIAGDYGQVYVFGESKGVPLPSQCDGVVERKRAVDSISLLLITEHLVPLAPLKPPPQPPAPTEIWYWRKIRVCGQGSVVYCINP